MTSFGLDVGGSAVKWVLLSARDEVLSSGREPTPAEGRDALVSLLALLVASHGAGATAVGIGLPAHVRRDSGRVVLLPNIRGDWLNYPLRDVVARDTGRSVWLLNDARAFALAELRAGAASGRADVAFATIGTGVGGAIALDGHILASAKDSAGELGHVMVDPEGIPCGCGGRGCLETVASATALVTGTARAVLLGHSAALTLATGGSIERLTPGVVTQAALDGDPLSMRVMARAGRALGQALGNVCALLTLDTVVIGGGAEGAIDLLLPHVERELEQRASLVPLLSVRRAALGTWAGATGAAIWARESSLSTARPDEMEARRALDH